jgi:hypothetical protein
MLRNIPRKVLIAVGLTAFLIELQLYVHRHYKPTEMLGLYLRSHLDRRKARADIAPPPFRPNANLLLRF